MLPTWVKIWMCLILVPVNLTSLLFLSEPKGVWIAFLACIGILANAPVLFHQRGFTKALAIPHLIPWTVLVIWILFAKPSANGTYDAYLTVLLIVNAISLLFDYPDSYTWLRAHSR